MKLIPDRAHLWQTLRLLLGCGVAELAGLVVGLRETYWALITAVVVTRPEQKDARGQGFDRVLGSLIGAIVGFGVLYGDRVGLPKWALLLVAFVLLAFLVAVRPNLRLSLITLIVIVLVPSGQDPLVRPFDRVIEIFIGSLAGWLVSAVLDSDRLRRRVPEWTAPEGSGEA